MQLRVHKRGKTQVELRRDKKCRIKSPWRHSNIKRPCERKRPNRPGLRRGQLVLSARHLPGLAGKLGGLLYVRRSFLPDKTRFAMSMTRSTRSFNNRLNLIKFEWLWRGGKYNG